MSEHDTIEEPIEPIIYDKGDEVFVINDHALQARIDGVMEVIEMFSRDIGISDANMRDHMTEEQKRLHDAGKRVKVDVDHTCYLPTKEIEKRMGKGIHQRLGGVCNGLEMLLYTHDVTNCMKGLERVRQFVNHQGSENLIAAIDAAIERSPRLRAYYNV